MMCNKWRNNLGNFSGFCEFWTTFLYSVKNLSIPIWDLKIFLGFVNFGPLFLYSVKNLSIPIWVLKMHFPKIYNFGSQ